MKMARIITKKELTDLLNSIHMKIGEWNNIMLLKKHESIVYKAPRNADYMYTFAQQIASYLPNGEWKLFQIDNSTALKQDEEIFLSSLLGLSAIDFSNEKSFLIEFQNSHLCKKEITIANLMFACILFECHAYFVSDGSHQGEVIAIQDGFVYFFYTNKTQLKFIQGLISAFESTPEKLNIPSVCI